MLTAHYTPNWMCLLHHDLVQARKCAVFSALSMIPPTRLQKGPWPALWRELLAGPARGLQTRVWLPAPTPMHPATRNNGTCERWLADAGVEVVLAKPPRLLHAKICVIDERIAWIGSGNYTQAASVHNHEAWVRDDTGALAEQLAPFWQTLESDNCETRRPIATP